MATRLPLRSAALLRLRQRRCQRQGQGRRGLKHSRVLQSPSGPHEQSAFCRPSRRRFCPLQPDSGQIQEHQKKEQIQGHQNALSRWLH